MSGFYTINFISPNNACILFEFVDLFILISFNGLFGFISIVLLWFPLQRLSVMKTLVNKNNTVRMLFILDFDMKSWRKWLIPRFRVSTMDFLSYEREQLMVHCGSESGRAGAHMDRWLGMQHTTIYRTFIVYWLSLLILSSGWLLWLNVDQTELK